MKQWAKHLFTGNYNILLILLLFLFLFRPYEYGEAYRSLWKTFLTITLIVAIFNCHHTHRVKVFISILAVPVLILTWFNLFYQTLGSYILTSIFTSFFLLICLTSIIYDVVLQPRVNLETLRGLICAYFLIAFLFAYIYFFLEALSPGTMLIHSRQVDLASHHHFFSDMLYFSFVTLLTVGFGDIVPAKEWGETATVIEGIFGQFYMAILVARIISVYAFMSGKKFVKTMVKPHNHPKRK